MPPELNLISSKGEVTEVENAPLAPWIDLPRPAMTKLDHRVRQNNTTGKSPKVCPALAAKIFRLTRRANQCFDSARLTADEGRVAIVRNVR
jgi:hypothetical protein